jgi:hypothetical protein
MITTSCRVTVAIGAAIRATVVQRRFRPAAAPFPSTPIAGIAEAFARSAAVFFGFFASRFDLFCPFAICVSNVRPANRSVSADRFAIYTSTDVACSMM